MEPNNSITPNQGKPTPEGKEAFKDLRDEGVEIVDSGSSEENEFSSEEKVPEITPTPIKNTPVEPSMDRAASIASVRSQFEDAHLTSNTSSPVEPKTEIKFEAKLSTPQAPLMVSAPVNQKPFVPQAKIETPTAPSEKPASTSTEAASVAGFQRISFGVADAMPKSPESITPAPVIPKPPVEAQSIPKAAEPVVAPKEPVVPKPPVADVPKAPVQSAPLNMPKMDPSLSFSTFAKAAEPAIAAMQGKNDPSIKPIRTFKSDAEEAVRYQNVSAIDIAVAEQKRREVTPTAIEYDEEKKSSGGLFIFIVLALLVLIAGGWYYWYFTTSGEVSPTPDVAPETKVETVAMSTIVPYAKGSTIALVEGSNPLVLIGAKLAASNAGLGNIFALVPTLSSTSTTAAPVESFLGETSIPARLLRSLGSEYMVGVYTFDKQNPFLIITNTFFQNAFSGMLEWEKDMREDFLPLIAVAHPEEAGVISGASVFEDVVVSNTDTRVLKNTEGRVIFAYAFADKDTIVMATDTETLKFLLDKLLTVRTIQ